MSQTFEFYSARAEESEAAAERANLDMVRERELRSASVWRGLADHARKVELDRAKAEEVRAIRRADEALLLAARLSASE